jgi:hypothetical protein
MQVSLRDSTTVASSSVSSRMTLAKDCRVYEKPDGKAKVLGMKKAGSAFSGQDAGGWVSFRTKDARTVYLPKGCF